MNLYTPFDYLCNEPFHIDGIGSLKCPTLREIRSITYRMFYFYLDLLLLAPPDYKKLFELKETDDTTAASLYTLLLSQKPQLLAGLVTFFLDSGSSWDFDPASASFLISQTKPDGGRQAVGHIGADSFDRFRDELKLILGVAPFDEIKPKFKNNAAKTLYEKLQKNRLLDKRKQDENYTLDNMILKYCTHNKSGVHILNVWDLTYYQFIRLFGEYCNARQCDFNDMMAAHTFSYKNSADYHPLEYIKKIKP